MKTSYLNSLSLMSDSQQHEAPGCDASLPAVKANKAETLREYQKLLEKINDVFREQQMRRRLYG